MFRYLDSVLEFSIAIYINICFHIVYLGFVLIYVFMTLKWHMIYLYSVGVIVQ